MKEQEKVLVIGASTNPSRYSYRAVQSLKNNGHIAIPMGVKKGDIVGEKIVPPKAVISGVDTVTLYLNPERQSEYMDYIFDLNPKRVIFNPGTENPEFESALKSKGIEVEESCTLVMLATQQF